jgi:putative transposase
MGRPPRVLVPGYPHHVIQRGHNQKAVFVEPADYQYYLDNLRELKAAFGIGVYAYCLMTNHVHLVLVPRLEGGGLSALMRRLSARQGRYVNRLESRKGTLWCGRFKCSVVDTDDYLLACLRYVELNPVRAGIVSDPADYRWSSHTERLGLTPPDLLDADRAAARMNGDTWRQYVRQTADEAEQAFIRTSVRRNQLTGGVRFVDEIERRTHLRIENRGPGRPERKK